MSFFGSSVYDYFRKSLISMGVVGDGQNLA